MLLSTLMEQIAIYNIKTKGYINLLYILSCTTGKVLEILWLISVSSQGWVSISKHLFSPKQCIKSKTWNAKRHCGFDNVAKENQYISNRKWTLISSALTLHVTNKEVYAMV